MRLRSLKQIKNLKNKKVLVRVGFDCPIKNNKVVDASRINQSLPTIRYLINKKAKIILISHLGRPLEHENINWALGRLGNRVPRNREIKKRFSLLPIYKYLKKLGLPIRFIDDCIGPKVKKMIEKMRPGGVVLLENLRFYPGEEKNDAGFARQLAELADLYVNEAFSVSHRRNASVDVINRYLPGYAGILLQKEISHLSSFLKNPEHPLIISMGGKKIETKIKPIRNLLKRADKVLIGGSLASNFFKAAGYSIGRSFWEPRMLKVSRQLLKNKKIVLPIDVRIKYKMQKSKYKIQDLKVEDLKTIKNRQFEIFDIGPKTIGIFQKYFKNAKMIFWNGPMGYFEDRRFSLGTRAVVSAILKNKKAKIVIGGGETIASLTPLTNHLINRLPNVFISSGGGAMLEFMEGKDLPGIKSLFGK